MAVLNFFLELLQTPAIVLAFVSLVGLVAQKRGFSFVLSGTVKTALGYLVLSAGSSLIVTEILPFVGLFQTVFGLDGFATGSEVIVGAMSEAVPSNRLYVRSNYGRRLSGKYFVGESNSAQIYFPDWTYDVDQFNCGSLQFI